MRSCLFLLGLICMMMCGSCANYYISVDSFKQQFADIDSNKLVPVAVSSPWGVIVHYKANPIKLIQCTDKKGRPHELANSPSIEMRITYGPEGERTIFYFDRVFLQNGMLYGTPSRLLPFIHSFIPLERISKIEVQDGRKRYAYVNH